MGQERCGWPARNFALARTAIRRGRRSRRAVAQSTVGWCVAGSKSWTEIGPSPFRPRTSALPGSLCIAIFCEWRHHYRMGSGTGSPKSNSNNGTVAVSRHVLPSDLPTAIKHLDDQELEQLFAAVVAERLQRGMKSPVPDKIPTKRSVEATAVSLTPGKLSAVRALQSGCHAHQDCQRIWTLSGGCSKRNCK
jgi:hypothetical protein